MHLNPFAVSNLLIILVLLPFAPLLLIKADKAGRVYALSAICALIWAGGAFIGSTTINPDLALVGMKIAYSGVVFIPIFVLHSILMLSNKKWKMFILFSYVQGIYFLLQNLNNNLFDLKFIFNSFYYINGNSLFFVSFILWVVIVVIAHQQIIIYYQECHGEKNLKFFIISMIVGFGGGITNYLPAMNINIYPYGNFIVPISYLITAYAALKYRFFTIIILIKRSIVYSILIAIISIAYLVIVVFTERVLQSYVGYQSMAFTVFAAFLIGILFIPLRNRIQSIIDKIFFQKSHIEMEEENKLLLREMEKTDKFKNVATLASGMAHEVKNPLTTIRTLAEYLPRKLDDPQFIEKFSRLVPKEIDRIDAMVQELLQFSRPSPPKLEPTDLYELLNNTLGFLSNNFSQRKIDVEKDYEAIKDRKFLLDANQIKQVVLNLCLNAIDAMPQGGNLTISTQLSAIGSQTSAKSLKTDGRLLITVKDTGCGISPEDQKNLFVPFFTTKEKGTGLGLSVTKGIIEQHGGKISVRSKMGEGTTFTLEFPLNREQ